MPKFCQNGSLPLIFIIYVNVPSRPPPPRDQGIPSFKTSGRRQGVSQRNSFHRHRIPCLGLPSLRYTGHLTSSCECITSIGTLSLSIVTFWHLLLASSRQRNAISASLSNQVICDELAMLLSCIKFEIQRECFLKFSMKKNQQCRASEWWCILEFRSLTVDVHLFRGEQLPSIRTGLWQRCQIVTGLLACLSFVARLSDWRTWHTFALSLLPKPFHLLSSIDLIPSRTINETKSMREIKTRYCPINTISIKPKLVVHRFVDIDSNLEPLSGL